MNSLAEVIALLNAGLSLNSVRHELGSKFLADLTESQRHLVERIFRICETRGVSATPALARLQSLFDTQVAEQSSIAVALSAPKATSHLVTWLPLAALGLAQLAGLNPFTVILSNRVIDLGLLVGAAFLFGGHQISKRMIARVSVVEPDQAIGLDELALTLEAGLPLDQAIEDVNVKAPAPAIDYAIELANRNGIAVAPLLTATADAMRRRQHSTKLEAIERLSVRLMIPLGITVLPAFLLLAVAPTAVSMVSH